MTNPKFQLFKGNDNQFYYRLKAANGEIILAGEGYTAKQSCLTGIASVKQNAALDAQYKRLIATNDQFYFTLNAGNGEVIGVSETYTTVQSRENGIEAVKTCAPNSETEDLTN
ncbi:YegP family protein [soil metagenome]